MKQFGERLDDKLKNDVDLLILDWIWGQLEQTGPAGKQYVHRFRAIFHEEIKRLQ